MLGEGQVKPRLQELAEGRRLDDALFLDPVPKTKLTGLMAGADIRLQFLRDVPAFYFGPSPNKSFDYIAAGLPVLINYQGWLAGLIKESDCGFAVRQGNPVALADALIAAATDRDALR